MSSPIGDDPSLAGALALAVALVEALDAAAGVDQLLLAGEERVALIAELDVQLTRLGGARRERVAARAAHGGLAVGGVNVSLHGISVEIGHFIVPAGIAEWRLGRFAAVLGSSSPMTRGSQSRAASESSSSGSSTTSSVATSCEDASCWASECHLHHGAPETLRCGRRHHRDAELRRR